MICNPDDYREFFKSEDMTPEQEDELILTLWEIARMFVEMGYGISPINNIFSNKTEKSDQVAGNPLS